MALGPRTRSLCISAALAGLAALVTVVSPAGGATTGTLPLRTTLNVTSQPAPSCPPGVPAGSVECFSRRGAGVVPGLGRVTHSYFYVAELSPSTCGPGTVRILGTSMKLSVAGKGDVELAVGDVAECLAPSAGLTPPARAFTVTGGTGAYAGASGNGTVKHLCTSTNTGCTGQDTFTGTIAVAGVEFDLTPPQLRGAAGKTVTVPRRAKNARVRYSVTAVDAADGARPVSCAPRSGSRFRIGRTTVKCTALDTSGNRATKSFRITVRRGR